MVNSMGVSILFVDDDESIRALANRALTEARYTVSMARSGHEAITLLQSAAPDLIVTDLVMPDMEGLELIQTLFKVRPALKVIAISGESEGLFLKAAELLGVKATLRKPFYPDQLLGTVARVLASGPSPR